MVEDVLTALKQKNQIGDEGAKALGEALAHNETLTALELPVTYILKCSNTKEC